MRNWKVFYTLAAAVVVLCLAAAPAALAYKVPGKPGTPGGKPTRPKGGSGTTKSGAGAVGTAIAGNTGSELAKIGHFSVTVTFPKGGTILAKISSAGKTLANGSVSSATAGKKKLTITFTKDGEKFLNSVNGQAVKLTIKFTFNPNKGKTKHSTSTVTLDA